MIEITREAAHALTAEVKKTHPYGHRRAYMNGEYEEFDLGNDTYVRIGCPDGIWWKYFLLTEVDRIIERNAPTPSGIYGGRPSDHLAYSAGKSQQTALALRSYGERLAKTFDERAAEQAEQAVTNRERGERLRREIASTR